MKTKLQIFKESTVYVFAMGFLSGAFHSILSLILGNESWVAPVLSGLLSFIATCVFMGYLFEKEKPLWLGSLQYIIIGIFATILTVIIGLMGLPFVIDIITNWAGDFFKNQISNSGLGGFLLIIPLFIVSVLFALFGLIAYLALTFFLGNWVFSYLLQYIFNRNNLVSDTNKSEHTN
jgi:ABC-type phosphate transport system permease subunit